MAHGGSIMPDCVSGVIFIGHSVIISVVDSLFRYTCKMIIEILTSLWTH